MERRISTSFAPLFALAAALAFLGAGCGNIAKQVVSTAAPVETATVNSVGTDVAALQKAQKVTAEAQAVQRRTADSTTNDVAVAMIIPDGTKPPAIGVSRIEQGTIGCHDTVAFTRRSRETDSGNVAKDALTTLFAEKGSTVNGLYNALWQSKLKVADVRSNGITLEVRLSGKVVSGGSCDDPRIKAQVEQTVAQYYPKYQIFLNGTESAWRCFGDASGTCK